MATIGRSDAQALETAVHLLERPGLTARLTNFVGAPIEKGFSMLPPDWRERVTRAVEMGLMKALDVAVNSLRNDKNDIGAINRWHKALVLASGAASGALGIAAVAMEIPLSTTLMLRSIAGIAQDEGEDISQMATRLECLQVLAFGADQHVKEPTRNSYWVVRTTLAKAVAEAASFIAGRGLVEEGAPPLVRLITGIGSRFGVVVSQEAAAKAIPLVGAFSGAAVNYLFLDHFQNMARGHFTVRRLELKYGQAQVRREYERLAALAA